VTLRCENQLEIALCRSALSRQSDGPLPTRARSVRGLSGTTKNARRARAFMPGVRAHTAKRD
jgi:hypothetical protein